MSTWSSCRLDRATFAGLLWMHYFNWHILEYSCTQWTETKPPRWQRKWGCWKKAVPIGTPVIISLLRAPSPSHAHSKVLALLAHLKRMNSKKLGQESLIRKKNTPVYLAHEIICYRLTHAFCQNFPPRLSLIYAHITNLMHISKKQNKIKQKNTPTPKRYSIQLLTF